MDILESLEDYFLDIIKAFVFDSLHSQRERRLSAAASHTRARAIAGSLTGGNY